MAAAIYCLNVIQLPGGVPEETGAELLPRDAEPVDEPDDGGEESPWEFVPAVTEEEAAARIAQLMEEFPDGMYWNHMGMDLDEDEETWNIVTDTPCYHPEYDDAYCNRYTGVTGEFFPEYDYLTQCLGFSNLISDLIFGKDAPVRSFRKFRNIRVGDQIRFTESWHAMVVMEKEEDYILVGEVDLDEISCQISWGRMVTREELRDYRGETLYLTRYPE